MKHTPKGKQFTNVVLEVFRLSGLLIIEGDQLTKELGLSSARWKVLGALVQSPGPMTVPQVARTMGQTRQAVQRLANEMVDDGLLAFETNPHHKRAKLLILTDKGKRVFEELEKKQMPWANSVAADIRLSDLQLTSSVLKKLINKLEA